ncbi:unnamed protein product [Strongylus vulgaris]|uniref:Uncharacterized protein n=1 Tax=Strongylus vulgaris TaxID=40348 RepID=A0A3P7ISX8_STRVU|nr:unnamed protein product [Strongylus vulgaris]
MKLLVLLALVPLSVQNYVHSSGYGDNNPAQVQNTAVNSPPVNPQDYTANISPGNVGRPASSGGSQGGNRGGNGGAAFDLRKPFYFPRGAVFPGSHGMKVVGRELTGRVGFFKAAKSNLRINKTVFPKGSKLLNRIRS